MRTSTLTLLIAALCAAGCSDRKLEEAQQIHVILLDRLAAQAEEIKRQSNVIQLYSQSYERAVIPLLTAAGDMAGTNTGWDFYEAAIYLYRHQTLGETWHYDTNNRRMVIHTNQTFRWDTKSWRLVPVTP